MNNKVPHSKQPQLCDECIRQLEQEAAVDAPWADHIVYCVHNLTFGLACVRQGTVCQFDLIAPFLPEQVPEAKKQMKEHARRNNLPFMAPGLH